jgi:hypothetical protein
MPLKQEICQHCQPAQKTWQAEESRCSKTDNDFGFHGSCSPVREIVRLNELIHSL